MTRNTSAKDFRAVIARVSREWIFRCSHGNGADRLALLGVPAADQAVRAAGIKRAVVGGEGGRPHRQAGTDQRHAEFSLRDIDNSDRAANGGSRSALAVG